MSRKDTTPFINAEELCFSYNGTKVINNMSLSISKGEFMAIVGPNGSGKSTFVRLASGVIPPDSGRISFDGKELKGLSKLDIARRMSIVPQEMNPAFSFTAIDIVLFGRIPYMSSLGFETAKDIDIVRDAMKKTDTLQFAERGFNELSSGEKQRVVIAKALAQQPEIMLLDEPTSFLDLRHQLDIYNILRKLNKEDGITVIVISHDINLAAVFCDRILMFKSGSVSADGRPDEIITRENIKAVYDVDVCIKQFNDKPFVVLSGLDVMKS